MPLIEGLCSGKGSELRGESVIEGRLDDLALSPSRLDRLVVDSEDGKEEPTLHRAKTWLTI